MIQSCLLCIALAWFKDDGCVIRRVQRIVYSQISGSYVQPRPSRHVIIFSWTVLTHFRFLATSPSSPCADPPSSRACISWALPQPYRPALSSTSRPESETGTWMRLLFEGSEPMFWACRQAVRDNRMHAWPHSCDGAKPCVQVWAQQAALASGPRERSPHTAVCIWVPPGSGPRKLPIYGGP
jgi:hypothetical protein